MKATSEKVLSLYIFSVFKTTKTKKKNTIKHFAHVDRQDECQWFGVELKETFFHRIAMKQAYAIIEI